MTDKSFVDRPPRPALQVRANSSKSSKDDCKGLSTRFNGFRSVSPAFKHGRVSHEAISRSELLSGNQARSENPVFLCGKRAVCRLQTLSPVILQTLCASLAESLRYRAIFLCSYGVMLADNTEDVNRYIRNIRSL